MQGSMFADILLACLALILHCSHVGGQKAEAGCFGLSTFVITVDYASEAKSLSVKAVSSLGECLTLCKATSDCQAANFYSVRSSTSPVCELLASKQSDAASISNATATPNIFKMYYAERICLPVASQTCPGRSWLFEKVPETRLQEIKSLASSILDTHNGTSLHECLIHCLRTEFCEAAIVKRPGSGADLPDCQLITVSRHTVRNPDHYFRSNSSFDMYESNCRIGNELEMDQPKSGCTFSNYKLHFRSPAKLYDQRMNGVQSRDQCQSLCTNFRQSPCRLYAFDRRQNACYLSHSRPDSDPDTDPRPVALDQSPFPEIMSEELDDCVQFDLACTPAALTINVSMSRMFRGSFGILRSDKPDCKMAVDNEQRFQLSLNYADCDVRRERSGIYSTIVSLKYGSSPLLTYKDRQVKLVCRQTGGNLDEIAVTTQLHVKNATDDGHSKTSIIAASQAVPIGLGDFELKILDLALQPAAKVQPGQEGYLQVSQVGLKSFEAVPTNNVVVTNLVASSVKRGEEVSLLDDRGCSLLKDLIKPFEPVDGARIWRARIRFFAFNDTSNKIHFSGLVKPCLGSCELMEERCKEISKPTKSIPVRLRRDVPLSDAIQHVAMDAIGEVIVLDPKWMQAPANQATSIDQR